MATVTDPGRRRPLWAWILDAVFVASATYLSIGVTTETLGRRGAPTPMEPTSLGAMLQINGVTWQSGRRTLVFALAEDCQTCTQIEPFIRTVLTHTSEGEWRPLAIMAESPAVATEYVAAHGYTMEAHHADLRGMGIVTIPTLLLIDQAGRVQQQWVGALTLSDEADVAAHLGIGWAHSAKQAVWSPIVTTAEFMQVLSRPEVINVIDVREREDFRRRHLSGATNIPVDELGVRFPHEALPDRPTVLYCSFSAACAAQGLPSVCSRALEALRQIGVTNARVLRDSMILLAEAGVPVDAPRVNVKR